MSYAAQTDKTDAQKAQARSNIGAAPDGYGLGANGWPYAYTIVTSDTVNDLNRSGLYWVKDVENSLYPDGSNSGKAGLLLHLHGDRRSTSAARQIFFPNAPVNGVGRNCRVEREKTSAGEWMPWEFVNPPLALGVEYRTTERYLGKPVYCKLVDFGVLPNKTSKSVEITSDVAAIIKTDVIGTGGAYLSLYDLFSSISSNPAVNPATVTIKTTVDASNSSVFCYCKYTKATD